MQRRRTRQRQVQIGLSSLESIGTCDSIDDESRRILAADSKLLGGFATPASMAESPCKLSLSQLGACTEPPGTREGVLLEQLDHWMPALKGGLHTLLACGLGMELFARFSPLQGTIMSIEYEQVLTLPSCALPVLGNVLVHSRIRPHTHGPRASREPAPCLRGSRASSQKLAASQGA